MQVVDRILNDLTDLAENWERQAEERLEFAASDPIAETMRRCAEGLRDAISSAEVKTNLVTVSEYAELHQVSRQAVHLWIKKGGLEAYEAEGGYQIPRAAVPVRGKSKPDPAAGKSEISAGRPEISSRAEE